MSRSVFRSSIAFAIAASTYLALIIAPVTRPYAAGLLLRASFVSWLAQRDNTERQDHTNPEFFLLGQSSASERAVIQAAERHPDFPSKATGIILRTRNTGESSSLTGGIPFSSAHNALAVLNRQFPNDPASLAAPLVYSDVLRRGLRTRAKDIASVIEGKTFEINGEPPPSVDLHSQGGIAQLREYMERIDQGIDANPGNAFFVVAAIASKLALRQDREALAITGELARAARWEDYTSPIQAAYLHLLAETGHFRMIERISASSPFPRHHPWVLDTARVVIYSAMVVEAKGRPKEGARIRLAVANLARLLLRDSRNASDILLSRRLLTTSALQLAGASAPVYNGMNEEDRYAAEHVQLQALVQWLREIGMPQSAQWVAVETERSKLSLDVLRRWEQYNPQFDRNVRFFRALTWAQLALGAGVMFVLFGITGGLLVLRSRWARLGTPLPRGFWPFAAAGVAAVLLSYGADPGAATGLVAGCIGALLLECCFCSQLGISASLVLAAAFLASSAALALFTGPLITVAGIFAGIIITILLRSDRRMRPFGAPGGFLWACASFGVLPLVLMPIREAISYAAMPGGAGLAGEEWLSGELLASIVALALCVVLVHTIRCVRIRIPVCSTAIRRLASLSPYLASAMAVLSGLLVMWTARVDASVFREEIREVVAGTGLNANKLRGWGTGPEQLPHE